MCVLEWDPDSARDKLPGTATNPLFSFGVLHTVQRTLVDVPLASALDHDVPELERLANVLQDRGCLVFVARTDEVGLG